MKAGGVPAAVDRFALAALLDRLIYGSDTTFEAADAIELRRLLAGIAPARGWRSWFNFSLHATLPGRQARGHAAGVGDVRLDHGDRSIAFDTDGDRTLRIGQWKVRPDRNEILIEQVMAVDAEEGRAACLIFEDAEPVALLIRVERALAIGPVVISIPRFRPWKAPSGPPPAA